MLHYIQNMLIFSFLAYLGFDLTRSAQRDSKLIHKEITLAINHIKHFKNKWKIVWGPGLYKIPGTIFFDNMMYVVQSLENPSHFVIAIRGTNPVSISNWITGDFLIGSLIKWKYQKPSVGNPKISLSTSMGLKALQNMQGSAYLPGGKQTLLQFLKQLVAKDSINSIHITVTGHSLGGALAPTLALWLKDTQNASKLQSQNWDPENKASIYCVSFAGPSPGNKDFAKHFKQQLGNHYIRVHNPLDTVTLGWDTCSLLKLFDLYQPHTKPNLFLKAFFYFLINLTIGKKYQQLQPNAKPLNSTINTLLPTYELQMIYQHVVSYLQILETDQHIKLNFLEQYIHRKHWSHQKVCCSFDVPNQKHYEQVL